MLLWHQDAGQKIRHIRRTVIDPYDRNIARFDPNCLFRNGMAMSVESRLCVQDIKQVIQTDLAFRFISLRE